jgi:heme oxygenase (biliverdin-IX-beta and delta-forming)
MIRGRRDKVFPQIWLLGGEQKGQDMKDAIDRGGICRRLMRCQAHAALATSLGGHPYASLVAIACGVDATPLLLLSDLAQHSRNIAADNRVSLLFDGGPQDHPSPDSPPDPLAEPRLSLLGEAVHCDDPRLLARFVARHPSAAAYAGFGDFRLYRVTIGRGHLVAGFGRIFWVEADDLHFADDAGALAVAESEIVAHMNADHADAIDLYAARLLHRTASGWRMTGIDPEGIDLRRDSETARLDFAPLIHDGPVLAPETARRALVALAEQARAAP